MSDTPETTPAEAVAAPKVQEPHPLDALTGGAFSAPTSGERAACVRQWLTQNPSEAQMQEVFRELSARDKGAARAVRERLDEIKRAKNQQVIAQEWEQKAQALLAATRLNIADALAWQRDAAKAGAPLSREPLSALKTQIVERIKVIEDLQHRVQVQREAAVLLAQRIEVLSTKSWLDAQAVHEQIKADVQHWQQQAQALSTDANWDSVEARFPPMLEDSKIQLLVVWEAFDAVLLQTQQASQDASLPLPPVPVWADELRASRGLPTEAALAAEKAARPARAKAEAALQEQASKLVREALVVLEEETTQGHSKASSSAALALRSVLKNHGRYIDDALAASVHAALVAAGELEGWQRWRADQIREELVAAAQALLTPAEGQALGGRKMQETLRHLREQWKLTDQGGQPNHVLWKRFDDACNTAYKVVEEWLDKVKAESAQVKAQRMALIDELKAWGATQTGTADWKSFMRGLRQFSDRWRDAGHLSEKAFAEVQSLWKQAHNEVGAQLEAAQKTSLVRRQALIAKAQELGQAAQLRIDAVRELQQQWQAEAQAVPLDRKLEQKLWDSFRQPIDDAFNRKTTQREKVTAALNERDKAVVQAAQALEQANASGDAQAIRAAMTALEQVLKEQPAQAPQSSQATPAQAQAQEAASSEAPISAPAAAEASVESTAVEGEAGQGGAEQDAAPVAPSAPVRRVVAVRGDDRPNANKVAPASATPARGARSNDRNDRRTPHASPRRERDREEAAPAARAPRLGDVAFKAQRDALEHAQAALRKLSAQAHGEALVRLLQAWEQREASAVPNAQELGSGLSSGARTLWVNALGAAPASQEQAQDVLLRLEMAAEVPTPAQHLEARRALQLRLLTQRNDPAPKQTWTRDAAALLSTAWSAENAQRLQAVLKVMLR